MSQQGERNRRAEDEWWQQLYDPPARNTPPPSTHPDSLDEHFVAVRTLLEDAGTEWRRTPGGEPGDACDDERTMNRAPIGRPRAEPGGTQPGTASGSDPAQGTGEPAEADAAADGVAPHADGGALGDGPAVLDALPGGGSSGAPETAAPARPDIPDPRLALEQPPTSSPDTLRLRTISRGAAHGGPEDDPETALRGGRVEPPENGPAGVRGSQGPAVGEPDAPGAPAARAASPAQGVPVTGPHGFTAAQFSPGGNPLEDVSAGHIGDRPPVYAPEPTAWPAANPEDLDALPPDTVLDGGRYGILTVRAASVRGDSARYRGHPRRDALLTARFGEGNSALLLLAVATGVRGTPDAHRAAGEACRWIASSVGRHSERLAEDIRQARRGTLKSGLQRLTDRCLGQLRVRAGERGYEPEEYSAALRCLLLPADPQCRIRVFFGVGEGGLFRLREGEWQDLDPHRDPLPPLGGSFPSGPLAGALSPSVPSPSVPPENSGAGVPGTAGLSDDGPVPPPRFRFRASVGHPGDVLLLCSDGMAQPLRGEPGLAALLAERWAAPEDPPGLIAFLRDTQVRAKGYADDRTTVAAWEE